MALSSREQLDTVFLDAVEREFAFLESFSFVAHRREPGRVCFESITRWIEVCRDAYVCEIDLSVGWLPSTDALSMQTVLALVDPEAARTYKAIAATSPDSVARGVSELAALLRRCTEKGVLRDPRLFHAVNHGFRSRAVDGPEASARSRL